MKLSPERLTNRYALERMRFGKLAVQWLAGRDHIRRLIYLCMCDCGALRLCAKQDLVRRRSLSCGCDRRHCGPVRHGDYKTPEYETWTSLIGRCCNPRNTAYANYGGRGIAVCARWRESYEDFLQDMGRRPGPTYSIDRIDNDGNYEPGNCRWATKSEQCFNRRTIRPVTANGVTRSVREWAEITGLPYHRILQRLLRGWAPEDAVQKGAR